MSERHDGTPCKACDRVPAAEMIAQSLGTAERVRDTQATPQELTAFVAGLQAGTGAVPRLLRARDADVEARTLAALLVRLGCPRPAPDAADTSTAATSETARSSAGATPSTRPSGLDPHQEVTEVDDPTVDEAVDVELS